MVVETKTGWNGWRIARWTAGALLLLTPLAMMQVSSEWNWGAGSFVFAGVLIGGVLLLYDRAALASPSVAYRGGVTVALAVSFLLLWVNVAVGIVGSEDNPVNLSFFMLVLIAAIGAFSADFRPAGMARAMLGTAGVQMLLALIIGTAPSTQHDPAGVVGLAILSAFFATLWLTSAALFRHAAKTGEVRAD